MTDQSTLDAYAECKRIVQAAFQDWKIGNGKEHLFHGIGVSFHECTANTEIPSYCTITLNGDPFTGRFPPALNRYYPHETETVDFNEVANLMMLLCGWDDVLAKDLSED